MLEQEHLVIDDELTIEIRIVQLITSRYVDRRHSGIYI
jgi:hypothetical protein